VQHGSGTQTKPDQGGGRGSTRPPWRRGSWTPTEVAEALQVRRPELRRIAGSRGDARGLDPVALDEVVDDAIRVVVMMRKPILNEEHLVGAFWTSARLLLRQHTEGRHRIRVGSRARQDFEDIAQALVADQPSVEESLLARDRAHRAADFISQLDEFERAVVMAVEGKGIKAIAPLAPPVAENPAQ
jgi:hypothetical protein